jgi:excisionase family DNA binding protein
VDLAVIQLPDEVVEALVTRLLAAVESRQGSAAGTWLSVEEAADYVRTSPDALRKAVQRAQVPAHQPLGPGTRYLFNRGELDRWAVAG